MAKGAPQITSGRVAYSRTVQPAQFESERAEVELSFVVEEGRDVGDLVDSVLAVAKERALAGLSVRGKRRVARSGGRFDRE